MQTAAQLYRTRVLKGAVPEAHHYPRMLCNQHCKTHIFLKDGIPYDQTTGLKHDCIMTRIAKMFYAHYNMIPIPRVKEAHLSTLQFVLDHQEEYNRKWNIAFDKWKKTGKVPMSYEVDNY
jgi:hypothetical protein